MTNQVKWEQVRNTSGYKKSNKTERQNFSDGKLSRGRHQSVKKKASTNCGVIS